MAGIETDERLYAAYLGGDEGGLRALLERHGDSLILYINGYIHDVHEAEDLMIEAFSRVIDKKLCFYENCFKAYLYKTARNLALRHAERDRRQACFNLEDLAEEPECALLVEQMVATGERSRILRLCLERLNPDYREALYLLYFEGLSYAGAARVMGKSIKQIDHLLERGKKALRPLLEQEGITNAQHQ